jgi:L-amino acid N-acyltransferase YncA
VARYARDETDPTTTEVAILVADEWQHRGVTRELMRPLMTGARDAGINGFEPRSSREQNAETSGPVMRRRLARHVGGRVIRSEERPKLDRAQESWPAGAIVE